MRKTLAVSALMLALCCPALAGEIPNPPAPQPPDAAVQEPTTTDGDSGAANTFAQIVLAVLASVLP